MLPAILTARKWGFPNSGPPETSYSTMHGGHVKDDTKVVRLKSDRGLKYIVKDRNEESEDRALIPAITFFANSFHTRV